MSPIKISTLTPTQIEKMEFYRKKWTDYGLSIQRTDYPLAEEGCRLAYEAAGLKAPKFIFWIKSPMGGALLFAVLKNWNSVGESVGESVRVSVRDSVGESVSASVWDSVGDSVGDSVWDSVRARVRDRVRDSVGDSVRASVWARVRDSVGDRVRDRVSASVGDSLGGACYGQHDAFWLGFYDYFREICGLEEETKKVTGLTKIAMACGWWWPLENAAILTERPLEIHLDARGRLHSDGKPALLYGDGWGIYSWHGVDVPEKYITTSAEKIDIASALKESNSSVRMAIIQKVGFLRLKSQIKNKTISKTDAADLLEFDLEGLRVRGLHVKWRDKHNIDLETIIPVPRMKEQFGEDCPEDIDNAEQVRRWTLFMKPEERLVMET